MLSRYFKECKARRNSPDSQTNCLSHVRAHVLLQNGIIAFWRDSQRISSRIPPGKWQLILPYSICWQKVLVTQGNLTSWSLSSLTLVPPSVRTFFYMQIFKTLGDLVPNKHKSPTLNHFFSVLLNPNLHVSFSCRSLFQILPVSRFDLSAFF